MAEYNPDKAAEQIAAAHQEKRLAREAGDRALQEFLDRGGVIQTVANNVSGRADGAASYSAWGKPKKKAAAAAPEQEASVEEAVDLDLDDTAVDDDPEELA